MSDFMLVNPLFLHSDPVESRLMTPYFPLGLLYLAATVREAGYEVSIFDAMFAENDDAFLRALARECPQTVGFGVLTTVRQAALRLAALAKAWGATVIVGGADPTGRPDLYLRHQQRDGFSVDVVVVGEAEETLLEVLPPLLEGKEPAAALNEVQGVAYRDEMGQIVQTPRRPLIEDVDRIPFPARDLLDIQQYRQAWRSAHNQFSLSVIATRGCPFGCAWCQKSVFGRSFRPRSPQSVAAEMALIKRKYQPDQIRIVDDVMGIDRDWVRAWHQAVIDRDAVIPFECLSRVDLMDEEIARLLKDLDCRRIHFGAESGSQSVLDAMNKGITVDQIDRAAELCGRLDIETYFYMMVGYPGETWSDVKRSVQLLRRTRPDEFSTTIAYPLPGTPFYEEVQDRLACEGEEAADWTHTAENRVLFERGRFSTLFYRRVIRWFHSEWRDARFAADAHAAPLDRFRAKLGLWRDRLLVNVTARLPGAIETTFQPTMER
ncbi:MAG: B12-binding domain-containing radical SAM protein [Anaerolineae bacterium]|nr:B12-binding domain-containing radical SAM protein [Anaerolineae bacterium]